MTNTPHGIPVQEAAPASPPSPFWRTVRHSMIAGSVAVVVSVLLAGGGHGSYVPAALCFPWTMLSTLKNSEITEPFAYLALVQFPLYGVLIGAARSVTHRPRLATIVIAIVATAHLLAVTFALGPATADIW